MEHTYIAGIEGGATLSTIVVMDQDGNIITKGRGPGTNHYLIGMEECQRRLAKLINDTKESIGMSLDTPFLAMGLGLSGCEVEEVNQQLVRELIEKYPNLSERYAIGSDTEGSIAATSRNGGVVCIAGTGSNCLIINPDGSKAQCGGWGYILGDEGSAWAVAHAALKYCFKDMDGFEKPPYSTSKIWEAVQNHFNINSYLDMIHVIYTNFDKAYISSLCKTIAGLALEGDPLSKHIFKQAGIDLAKMIDSVTRRAHSDLKKRDGGIHVLCVGSVWLSWNLLREGFESYLNKHSKLSELSLMKITTIMAVGAAYMAADQLDISMPRDYIKNYEVFYNFKKCNAMVNNHE